MNIAVACGGTGGHLMPGLLTAQELRRRGHDVVLWLAGKRIESAALRGWPGRTRVAAAEGLTGGGGLGAVRALAGYARAALGCLKGLRADRTGAMLAMGSYSSVGPVLAARCLGIPVVLHEANAVPGRSIAWLAPLARTVAVTFPECAGRLRARHTVVTGLPVRPKEDLRFGGDELDPGRFTLLVMGGSQGARALNDLLGVAVCRLHAAGAAIQVVHLAGRDGEGAVRERYRSAGVRHVVFGFLSEMCKAYNAADFAVCRAGANSCVELAAYGVAALLVPYPFAVRDHQSANARSLAATGGADWRPQDGLTADWLRDYLGGVMADGPRRAAMRAALAAWPSRDADRRLAAAVEDAAAAKRPSARRTGVAAG